MMLGRNNQEKSEMITLKTKNPPVVREWMTQSYDGPFSILPNPYHGHSAVDRPGRQNKSRLSGSARCGWLADKFYSGDTGASHKA